MEDPGALDRQDVQWLLDDAEAGHFQRVVFAKMDRLARSLRDLLSICDRLEAAGVGIVSIGESIDTGTPAGRMMRNMLGTIGEFERETNNERTRVGIAQVLREGKTVGHLPVGYRRQDGKLLLDPDTAPAVAQVFRDYATGLHSLRQLMPSVVETLHIGNSTSLAALLRNPIYLGHVTHKGKVVAKDAHPPIVEKALFERVGRQLEKRSGLCPTRPFGRKRYALTGLAFCASCGTPLVGTTGGKNRIRYMRCQTAQRLGKDACRQPMVRAEVFEEQVATYISGMVLPEEIVEKALARAQKAWEAQYDPHLATKLRGQVARLRRLFVLGEINEAEMKQAIAPLKKELATADRPQEAFDIEIALECIRDMGEAWRLAKGSGLSHDWLDTLLARIVVDGPQVTSITPTSACASLFVADREERFGGFMAVGNPPFGHPTGSNQWGVCFRDRCIPAPALPPTWAPSPDRPSPRL
ncbi:MAG: recombinase family protein [Chloroflexi bacterium]|nr:recombinase family protein [Chloroflexota bacterium]